MGRQARLNVQGLARRDKGLMSCILAEPDHTLVSIDLAAGEPTVTAHYSRDPNYCYATFDGVGKPAFYRDSVLMIADIYAMTMSTSPIGSKIMRDVFNTTFDGKTFNEIWLTDPDFLMKGVLKDARALHKMLALALSYGMGPKKMVKQCYDNGYTLDLKTAQQFYAGYWQLFRGVRRLADNLSARVKKDGHIVNAFGYRLTPKPHNAFNAFIQSSVSGIIHVFNSKLFALAPYAQLVTIIHDEDLVSVPTAKILDFKAHKDQATDSLNKDLKWTTHVRTGFASGGDWYQAK
jgi:hypothetical protein